MKQEFWPSRADPKYSDMASRALALTFTRIDLLAASMPHAFAKDKARKSIQYGFNHPYARAHMGYMVQFAPDDVNAAQAYFNLAGMESKRARIQWRNAAVLARWCRRFKPGQWPAIRRQLSNPWNA